LTETALIKACLSGDHVAQKLLFDRYSGKMMAVCLRYSRHRMEAEDIMQDGFIRVYEKMHTFKFKGSFEGWIRRIMINTAIRNFQKASIKKEKIGIDDHLDSPVEANAIHILSEKEILKEVSKLPDGYRMVFNLYAIEGYKHSEIAEMLSIKESTSRSQLVKARRMLQKSILNLQAILV
jgi:RNA polymerase sigma-70 factor (ECF subfamily)